MDLSCLAGVLLHLAYRVRVMARNGARPETRTEPNPFLFLLEQTHSWVP
jgi:hypothetical protein